jgi:hypothetical protein
MLYTSSSRGYSINVFIPMCPAQQQAIAREQGAYVRPFIADEQVFAPFPEAVANDRWHVVCYSGYVRMPRRVLAQLGGGGGGGGGGAIACYRVLAQLSLRFAWLLAALAIACQLS